MSRYHLSCRLLFTTILFLRPLESNLVYAASYLPSSFHFDYVSQNNLPVPAPVTGQCERIQLQWSRGANDNGPNPIAPYSMIVYSSNSSTPLVVPVGGGPTFSWDVPFTPLNQYQICMFDVNGNSGGCQASYTMITNSSTSTPSCQSSPGPKALPVVATSSSGSLKNYGTVDQCTSLSVSPRGGSPPYILTVAPASHPPYNITSNGDVSWQVALPLGYKFFLSLSSADGLAWSNGPFTVGGQGPTSCLAPGTISKAAANKIVIAGSFGGIIAGIVAGMFGVFLFTKLRKRRQAPSDRYFGGAPYYARDRPLKAPSTIAGSVIAPSSYIPFTPTASSIPLMPSSQSHLGVPPSPPPPPLPPLVPNRRQHSRQRSNNTLNSTAQSDGGAATTQRTRSTRTHATHTSHTTRDTNHPPPSTKASSEALKSKATDFPPDIKVPLPTVSPDASALIDIVPRDDGASQVSSSSRARPLPRPVSVQSKAPTYVPRSTPLTGPDNVIAEDELPDVPPEYGRHTNDPSLNYAPNLSSGNRF